MKKKMFKNHFGETVIVVLSLVMGFIMSVAVIIIDGLALNFSNVFKIWAMITLVIFVVSIFIPYKEWSGKLSLNVSSAAYDTQIATLCA